MSGAFDTLSFARRLEQGGFSAEQARTLATEQAALLEQQLASKLDIARLEAEIEASRSDLKRDIERLRSETARDTGQLRVDMLAKIEMTALVAHNELEIAKRELTIRIVGTLGGIIILAVTVMGFLFRFLPHA